MKNIRFQTDYRLWLWIALALFLASWCFPIIPDKAGGTPIERVIWLVNFAADGNTTFNHILAVVSEQTIFSMIVSILLAWPIQVAVVIVRTTKREIFDRIANPRRLLQFGIAAVVLMGIFPPWIYTSTLQIPGASLQDLQCSWGYSFILDPPTHKVATFTIDVSRLVGQWVGVALIAGCIWLYYRPNRRLLLIASSIFVCVLAALVITGYSRSRYVTSKELVDGQVSEMLVKMGGIKDTNGVWIFPVTNSIHSHTN